MDCNARRNSPVTRDASAMMNAISLLVVMKRAPRRMYSVCRARLRSPPTPAILPWRTAEAITFSIAAAVRHGKIAGVGGDRNLARQMEYIRRGARFITTNSEIAFIMAEASRVTGELRRALQPSAA